jgi:transcriptional activator of comK gene
MMKKIIGIALTLLLLTACSSIQDQSNLTKAGLLVPDTISDQVWGTKGYKGMLKIQSKYNVDVFYKEGMNSKALVEQAVKEFDQKGVNLIFGHGSEYAEYFNEIANEYKHIHFVSFNGNATASNTTSLQFKGFAMGYFGGMTASHMSKTKKVAVLAAYEWQPEVKGFIEGVQFQNSDTEVIVTYTHNWDDVGIALEALEEMIAKGVDVVYPAGDGFNVPVIEKLKEQGLYAIGYVSDQSDLGETTVLTSTVQHIDKLYELVAEKFIQGALEPGNLQFDFQDGVISMGKFSPLVDNEFKEQLNKYIDQYIKTGQLPDELPMEGS